MSEPRRLREMSGSAVEHALLSAGASYKSSPEAHSKTLSALGLASSAVLSAGVAGAATTSWLTKLGLPKLISLLSLSAALIVPAGYFLLRHSGSDVEAARPVMRRSAPVERAELAPRATLPNMPSSPPSAEQAALAPLEAPKAAAPAARTAKPEASSKVDSVAAELDVLDGVRSALAQGDTAGALTRLDGYAKAFPRGRLALEAEVLRIDALARSGQSGAATKRAEAFLRRHPKSLLASRVRGYLKPAQ